MFARKFFTGAFAGLAMMTAGFAAQAAETSAQILEIGKELFAENCEACHQADAIGQPGLAPSLTNPELLNTASDKFFEATIRDGREDTGMGPFAHLGRKNVRAIVAFLRSHAKGPNRAAEVDAQRCHEGITSDANFATNRL